MRHFSGFKIFKNVLKILNVGNDSSTPDGVYRGNERLFIKMRGHYLNCNRIVLSRADKLELDIWDLPPADYGLPAVRIHEINGGERNS